MKFGEANYTTTVLSYGLKGTTTTLWIGRDDSLIHQMRTEVSAADIKASLQAAAKRNPNFPMPAAQDVTSVETHNNIVLNPQLTAADFGP